MDPTCVDLTSTDGIGLAAAFLAPRLVLLVLDKLKHRYGWAMALSNVIGTVIGGKSERFAKPEPLEGPPS